MRNNSENDRQLIEDDLRASKEKYRQFVSNIPGIVYQLRVNIDRTFSFLFISDRVKNMLGYRKRFIKIRKLF
jgi:hypothetical protein